MLRRYLIVNGVSTALMYLAYAALVPSTDALVQFATRAFDMCAMESVLLAPIYHGIVSISGGG